MERSKKYTDYPRSPFIHKYEGDMKNKYRKYMALMINGISIKLNQIIKKES